MFTYSITIVLRPVTALHLTSQGIIVHGLCIKINIAFDIAILVNSMLCCSLVDPYGFERPVDFDVERHEEFMSHYIRVLARRAKRWATLMKGRSNIKKSSKC